MALCNGAIRALVLFTCLVSTLGADSAHRPLVRKRAVGALAEGVAAVPSEQLKEMLSKVMQNPQMQQMGKDPHMVRGLMELMKDEQKMTQLTQDADLAQSLHSLVEKDPGTLNSLMREAGFAVGMTPEDIADASIEEIHAEFLRLSKTDEEHMQRLKKSNELRDALKEKLGAVVNQAVNDKGRVNKQLSDIHSGKANQAVAVAQDGSLIESQKKTGLEALEQMSSAAEIESALDELAKHIGGKIHSLLAQDEMDLEALEDNAKLRSALKDKLQERIAEQQRELSFASGQ